MTEQEWLSSEDPRAMLRTLEQEAFALRCDDEQVGDGVGDRKLRLWVAACREAAVSGSSGWADDLGVPEWLSDSVGFWADGLHGRRPPAGDVPMARRAALLREIVGDPFRPVTVADAWLTPDVLALARAACDERRQVGICGPCKGTGRAVVRRRTEGAAAGDRCRFCRGRLRLRDDLGGGPFLWCPQCMTSPTTFDHEDCRGCGGSGRTTDGTLDPFRLALAADALEEAGCGDESLLTHLRSAEHHGARCPLCRHLAPGVECPHCVRGVWYDSIATTGRLRCDACRATGKVLPPDEHVPGCWALDMILGRD